MSLQKYVDSLPIPDVLKPKSQRKGITYYEVTMKQVKQKLHRDLPETTVWGYEGLYPGPTIEVRQDETVNVKWINELPIDKHFLPVDITVHGAEPNNPRVRTVVHLHGGNVPPESDGYPEAWFTKDFQQVGPFFTQKVYDYPNIQPAATLWYHDHALGITRLNVYAGLAGFYLLRDDCEDKLNLPSGKYEIPFVIQDRTFNDDGSLFYPELPEEPPEGFPPDFPFPSVVPEFFGDTILVNGKVWPFLEVEPRKYRFRILNGSNSRFYRLRLSSGQSIIQIGTDQGFLEKPVEINELILAPGERADVILDFSQFTGKEIIITNNAPVPFPDGDPVNPAVDDTGQIMLLTVNKPLAMPDLSSIPSNLCPIEILTGKFVNKVRDLTLIEETDEFGRLLLLLTGRRWFEPITEKPRLGSIEKWRLINVTPDTHPIHLHLVKFQILYRQSFDLAHYEKTGNIRITSPKVLPDLNEKGWKDTVRANPGEITTIITRFESFDGLYAWHCHILEHEDHEMMRPFIVEEDELEE